MRLIIVVTVFLLSACSTSQVHKVAKVSRILTGGEHPKSTFMTPTVKEVLEHEMRVCLDGNYKSAELIAECTQVAVAKAKARKGLDAEIDLGGEVIVEKVDDNQVIDNRESEDKKESENDPQ